MSNPGCESNIDPDIAISTHTHALMQAVARPPKLTKLTNFLQITKCVFKGPWRSEGGQGGASAPGRRPEGGAKILPKN